uniref:Uncharacterized protein n=1 Tax=Tetraselmis sp. GSL018 TaxID=582737 RepID=A0A061SKY3_9CHLO
MFVLKLIIVTNIHLGVFSLPLFPLNHYFLRARFSRASFPCLFSLSVIPCNIVQAASSAVDCVDFAYLGYTSAIWADRCWRNMAGLGCGYRAEQILSVGARSRYLSNVARHWCYNLSPCRQCISCLDYAARALPLWHLRQVPEKSFPLDNRSLERRLRGVRGVRGIWPQPACDLDIAPAARRHNLEVGGPFFGPGRRHKSRGGRVRVFDLRRGRKPLPCRVGGHVFLSLDYGWTTVHDALDDPVHPDPFLEPCHAQSCQPHQAPPALSLPAPRRPSVSDLIGMELGDHICQHALDRHL